MVPDLKSFVKPNVLKQAEERHSQLQASSAADLGLQQREEIGLDFVEEIVTLFLQDNALNSSISCLQQKRAARLVLLHVHGRVTVVF